MTDRELMQMALDALEEAQDYTSCPTYSPSMTQQCATAAVALRARLAQPEPDDGYCQACDGDSCTAKEGCVALNNPPQREWVALTDEEIFEIWSTPKKHWIELVKVIQAKLKEKNT